MYVKALYLYITFFSYEFVRMLLSAWVIMKTLQIELLEGFWAAICVTEKDKITNAENLV